MHKVSGHKDWWKISEYPNGNATYKHYTNGKESRIFIIREKVLARSFNGYPYEVFYAGMGKGGTAAFRGGSSTLNGAIKKANELRNS